MKHLSRWIATTSVLVAVSCYGTHLIAATVTESGPLFDVEYDNSGFFFETGLFFNDKTMVEEPFIEQLGGYSIIDPRTIRYSLPPQETHPDPIDPSIYEIVPSGDVEVGGSFALTTDSDSASGMFRIIPTAGVPIRGVTMTVNGSYNNPVEDATILYTESISAGGDSDGLGLSLGIFSSGPLPTGSSTMFPDSLLPIDVEFEAELDATSSSLDFSFAQINNVEFTVDIVPEPCSALMLLMGSICAFGSLRRRA